MNIITATRNATISIILPTNALMLIATIADRHMNSSNLDY